MRTVLITGANRGIGLELTRQLAERGDAVIAVCRHASPGLESLRVEIIDGVDAADPDSIQRLADQLDGRRIDVLINNAGVLSVESLNDMDFARIERQIAVNALGPLRVTHALLGNMKSGAKVAVITSRMGSIGDNGSGGYYGYRMSKAAVNAAFRSLALDLRPRGVAVLILHPGMVATEMTGGSGIPVTESAANLVARLDALTLADTGTFHHANGDALPW